MRILQIVKNISPRRLFLIDALGALLSAFMLGGVLVNFTNIIGMPVNVLYILTFFPVLFFFFSLSCYVFTLPTRPYLKIIAIANLLYCCLTLSLMIYLSSAITHWGLLYFGIEIIIVLTLAFWEYHIATKG